MNGSTVKLIDDAILDDDIQLMLVQIMSMGCRPCERKR